MPCPNCKRRIRMNANRLKVRGTWFHKRCPKEPGLREALVNLLTYNPALEEA